jgi:putative transposase
MKSAKKEYPTQPQLKYKITTDSKHRLPVAANLLDHQSLSEYGFPYITYIWKSEGCVYLSVIIDLFSRQVVGLSLSKRIDIMDGLLMVIWCRQPDLGLIFYSDRGSQYCSAEF